MPDERSVRKRVVLRMLGHPLVLAPAVTGATLSAGALALGGRPGLAVFSLLAGALLSLGAFITRLVVDDGRTARTIWDEVDTEAQRSRQAALDELDRRLTTADRDPRPETALRDLRALMIAFDEFASQAPLAHQITIVEIQSKVRQIFDQSLESLEQTLKLGDTAARLQSAAARTPILEQRERLVSDIEAGIRQLGTTLAGLQRLVAGGSSQSELARLRDDLDASLDLANTVETRLQALLHETDPAAELPPSVQPPTLEKKG